MVVVAVTAVVEEADLFVAVATATAAAAAVDDIVCDDCCGDILVVDGFRLDKIYFEAGLREAEKEGVL